ncbi:hypothetical protein Dimus_014954 [Dionaea muscipula]
MASLIAASTQLTFRPKLSPSIPRFSFVVVSQRQRTTRELCCLKQKLQTQRCDGVLRSCKKREEGELDECEGELEAKIVMFMNDSKKPHMFPTRRELIDAGRMDLVEAIVERGGWMTLGWDVDDEKEKMELVDWRSKLDKYRRTSAQRRSGSPGSDVGSDDGSFVPAGRSSPETYTYERSLEVVEEDTGIEGILNRLEKQRNSIGLNLVKNNDASLSSDKGNLGRSSSYADSRYSERSQQAATVSPKWKNNNANSSFSHIDELRNSMKPDTWRTGSVQRAGFADREFDAGEINIEERRKRRLLDSSAKRTISTTKDGNEPLEELNACDQIRSRLQSLEVELSSALHLLRSNPDDLPQKQDQVQSSEEWNKLSDAWEFQQSEIMRTKDNLRSIRANIAVLEGKMALAINDAQRAVDEKQRRINDARMALQLLRTAYIIWPNSASEVLLSGSFDGWTTQRKMEKSISGVFSLSLKLYPGRYEIKFIVDGVWKVDPLRPVVHCDGYENNLLIIA